MTKTLEEVLNRHKDIALDFFDRTDWDLLRKQKEELLKACSKNEVLDGILHLIDELQDDAADMYGEERIFGRPNE